LLGRFAWWAGLGEGSHEVEDGAELGQAHAVAVEEILQGEAVVERVSVLGQTLGRIPSRYRRRLSNLPAKGRAIRLEILGYAAP
jgi:hypothetical protein